MIDRTHGVIDATDETFAAEVEQAAGLTVVDFHATWCGPCRLVGPIIDQLAQAHAGRVRVVKVDVDESPITARRYGIRSIPSVLIFRDGVPADTVVGAASRAEYERRIQRLVA
ncbi:MAG TPA: thioredoxin [Gemmatimonadales bacterium]|nr:thioredoxin [Gemmatimonadales bacterium]